MDNIDLDKIKDALLVKLRPDQDTEGTSVLYAVIDGAAIDDVQFILPTRTENFHCLFLRPENGQPFMEEAAPYLISIDNDEALLNWLLEEFYGDGAISFYYSRTPLEELATHFSHYPLIWVEETREHKAGEAYLGFYDPRVMPGFVRGLGSSIHTFFAPIDNIICELEEEPHLLVSWMLDETDTCQQSLTDSNTKGEFTQTIAISSDEGIDESHTPIKLTSIMMNALNQHELSRNTNIMAHRFKSLFKDDFGDISMSEMRTKVYQSIKRMQQYGFNTYPNLFTLAAWELYYGPGYEQLDNTGALQRICQSSVKEDEKFVAFQQRIEQIDFNNIPTSKAPQAKGTANGQ